MKKNIVKTFSQYINENYESFFRFNKIEEDRVQIRLGRSAERHFGIV